MSGYLLWTVFVDGPDEDIWRATLGQASIDDWCRAHAWDAKDIVRGSVVVYAYRNGHTEVVAEKALRDAQGKCYLDGDSFARVTVASPLRRSLPEGIGTVIR